jgi:hypothetical protein
MAVIDDEGRVFGLVNIIDLLVVLVVFAVVAAGAALVLGDDTTEAPGTNATSVTNTSEPTRYATLSVSRDRVNLSKRIVEGDTIQPLPSGTNLTVTETYVGPTNSGTRVVARVRYNGTLPTVDGSTVPIGDAINFREDDIAAQARLLTANETRPSLRTGTTPVVVETNIAPERLDALQAGDELTLEGQTVATVASVRTYPRAGRESVRAVIGLQLETFERQGESIYGASPVRIGREIGIRTGESEFEASITQTGRTAPLGEPTPATVTVELRGVSPTIADQLSEGMRERHRNATATITNVQSEPATTTVRTDDGRLVETTHPRQRDVTLTVDVTARQTSDGVRVHDRRLEIGNQLTLDFGRIEIRGAVTDFRTN